MRDPVDDLLGHFFAFCIAGGPMILIFVVLMVLGVE